MSKKCDVRAELLFCQSKPIAFLPFSLPSPSWLLKLSNIPSGIGWQYPESFHCMETRDNFWRDGLLRSNAHITVSFKDFDKNLVITQVSAARFLNLP